MQWLMEKQGRIHSNLIGVRMSGAVGSALGRGIDVGDRSQNAKSIHVTNGQIKT